MANRQEQQTADRIIFQEGKVWVEIKGVRKPIENVISADSPDNIIPVKTFKEAVVDWAELNDR